MKRRQAMLTLGGAGVLLAQSSSETPEWVYLENEALKLGIHLKAGACIGWLSTTAEPEKNLLNTYDVGRYVQQSYYGDPDGSDWNGQPWRYNPVQGGGWRGDASEVTHYKLLSETKLESTTTPRHWATGKKLPEVTMQQTISLEGPMVRIAFRMTYQGAVVHKAHHQELPAFFVQPEFDTLIYDSETTGKDSPLTEKQLGEKNEYIKLREPWLAWVSKTGQAVGVMSPGCQMATCYRVPGPAACSYAAPLKTFALIPGLDFTQDVFVSVGKVGEIRQRFAALTTSR
jgi:hypothetical protein